MRSFQSLLSVCVVVCLSSVSVAAETTQELARYLPAEANSVAVLRVGPMLNSERAKQERWAGAPTIEVLGAGTHIPTWADTIVTGSLVRPALQQEVWSTTVLELPPEMTMERLSLREDARVEDLGGRRAVLAGDDAWLIEIRHGLLGVRSPAMRQEAARWAQAAAEGSAAPLSPFLQQALTDPAHIVLAIELQDMVNASRIREYLDQSSLLPADPVERLNLLHLLSTQQGITLSVTIDTGTSARVAIHFGESPAGHADSVAAIFRQLVSDQQMSLDEFATATVSTQPHAVTLTMTLSDASLRQIVSLVASPSPGWSLAGEGTSDAPSDTVRSRVEIEVAASKRYYRSVSQAIDDLARASRRGTDDLRTATWHENFARRIDELPKTGVDPTLLKFGDRISDRFRALAASLHGQAVQINAEQQTLVYNVDYRPAWVATNWWGAVGYRPPYVKVTSNLKEVRERQAAAVKEGSQQRNTIWKLITDDRSDVEARMLEKYGPTFFQRGRR